MERKYEFTDETAVLSDGVVLRQIKALRDIATHGVRAGRVGGFIENEANLDHAGDAWVAPLGRVHGCARVGQDALVDAGGEVFEDAVVAGHAVVHLSRVRGTAYVAGYARIVNQSEVAGRAQIAGDTVLDAATHVSGRATLDSGHLVFQWVDDAGQRARDAVEPAYPF